MESLFLSREELIALTGYRQRSRQVEWLQARGYTVEVNAAHQVLVLRDHVRQVLGGPGYDPAGSDEPDLAAIDGWGNGK